MGNGDREPSSPPCLMHEFAAELLPRPPAGATATGADTTAPPAALDWPAVQAFRRQRRAELLASRASLPLRDRRQRSERLRARLLGEIDLPRDAVLGFYWPIKGEPDLRDVARRHVEAGGIAALPVVPRKNAAVEFWRWEPEAPLRVGFWNIPVPAERQLVVPSVLLIPLVGFDGAGYRLGYGGGYYDRTLAALAPRPLCVGVGYAAGELATIYPQPHDLPMQLIVTDDGVRRIPAPRP